MENGTVLFTTLFLCLIIGVISKYILFKGHKNQKEEYPRLWEEFQKTREDNSFLKTKELIELGNKIVYNKYVPTKHLEIIQEVAKDLEFRHPKFKELHINAYDKWIHHTQGHGNGPGAF